MDGFYQRDGDGVFIPTRHAEGPWAPGFQHGGPPAALLTRAVEEMLDGDALRLGRMTVEILGPVPLEPLRLETRVRRGGKRVRQLEATLATGERPVVVGTAWAVTPTPDDVPVDQHPEPSLPPPPDELPAADPAIDDSRWDCGYVRAMEWRFVHGEFGKPGPATVWIRPRVPLVAGEEMSPRQRVALAADAANGVTGVLDIDTWMFIPPELTIHFIRPPVGEWICLDGRSHVLPGAVGLAESALYDARGTVARSAQTLLVARHLG